MLRRVLDTGRASLKKFRYYIWYGLVIAILVAIATIDLSSLPSGLTRAEMQQAVTSNNLYLTILFDWTINGLYNLVQNVTTGIFGISRLGLVIPSIIFSVLTIIVFTLITSHWFRSNVAIISTIITALSVVFLGLARSGTPEIMLVFWSSLLLYAGLNLLSKTGRQFWWKLVAVFASLGLLYTPLGIYPLLAIFGSAVFHPHVRSRMRRISRTRLLILLGVGLLGITPLIISLIMVPGIINVVTEHQTISGSFAHLGQNLSYIFNTYLNATNIGFAGHQITPAFSLIAIVLALLGIFRSVSEYYTARSYVLLSWMAVAVLLIILIPQSVTLIFLPIALLVAIGIETLVLSWFSLFPKNPYARTVGLVPLAIIFIGMATSNVAHYFESHMHIKNHAYDQSINAVQRTLAAEGNRASILVTTAEDEVFYRTLTRQHKYVTITSTAPTDITLTTLVLPKAKVNYETPPSHILTSGKTDDSVTLRVYRPQ